MSTSMAVTACSFISAAVPSLVEFRRTTSALKSRFIPPFSAQRWSLDRIGMRTSVGSGRKPKLIIRAARKESKGASLSSRAPDFELQEPLTGKMWKLDEFEAYPALLVMFICNHCPFVIHLKKDIVRLSNFYMKKKGLAVVAISSNSIVTHPQDGPEFMAEDAKLYKYPFPYLYDESQEVAQAFGAVCTPEFFLYKKDGRRPFELVYHGQFDDSRPSNNVRITGRDLSLAIEAVLSGQPVPPLQKPRYDRTENDCSQRLEALHDLRPEVYSNLVAMLTDENNDGNARKSLCLAYQVALQMVPDRKYIMTLLVSKDDNMEALTCHFQTCIISLLVPLLDDAHNVLEAFDLTKLKSW